MLQLYSEIKDDYLRERGSDIEDVMRRLLVALSGVEPAKHNRHRTHHRLSGLAAVGSCRLDLEHARALATDSGGWTSHTAILARGVGIPAVVGLRDFYRRTKTGDTMIVDSTRNQVILHPSATTLAEYQDMTRPLRRTAPAERGPSSHAGWR